MTLLERYILRRATQMFLVALLPVLAIIWTIQVLQRINLVTDTGQSMGSFVTLATMLLPTLIPVVLPFALVIAITQTLTAMNTDSELAIIDASGAPRSIIFKPILILGTVLSLVSFGITNFAEPPARTAARQMVAAAYADLLSSVIEEKTFRTIQDGLYVQIGQRQGRILRGLFVADRRDPNYDLIYYAKEGMIDEGGTSLTMRDGEVQQKTPDGKVSVVKFLSYAFDLSTMSEKSDNETSISSSDASLSFLLSPDPTVDSYKKSPGGFRSELHRRLSDWMFPFVFALISLVVAADARSHREARLHPMVAALITAFMLRWLGFYFTNQVKQSAAFIPFVYAVPFVSGGIATFLLLSGKKLLMPRAFGNALQTIQKRFSSSKAPGAGGQSA
ncbi:LPS export ABC transporter permease LptF [Agrobacterium vaccinii]|uniref:LPS export ABC transporter permease LptF n=1 Tax=Agrobacterium TaxID=357 RepID=UPI000DD62867|nr:MULTISPECIES: LPS export ABC transporter permease LptF [Agrobacterium]UHS56172.1 LPS export ABC transporter permease LptF [Agrobacterium vaccinii]UHS60912.1 LPS export ABC transporter permease LptF [Agrobacterium vaccinii]